MFTLDANCVDFHELRIAVVGQSFHAIIIHIKHLARIANASRRLQEVSHVTRSPTGVQCC